MRATTGLIAVAMVMTALRVFAAPLKLSLIAADADWVAHLDMEALKQTEVRAFIDREMRTPEAERKLDACKAMFAFDPRDDLKSLSAYGTGQDGVMIIEGVLTKAAWRPRSAGKRATKRSRTRATRFMAGPRQNDPRRPSQPFGNMAPS